MTVKIALDVHGGDYGLVTNLEGAILAARKLEAVEIILVGNDPAIREALRRMNVQMPGNLRIIHASQVVEMSAEPVQECRSKPNSSLVVCAELVADGKAGAFVSAGNSGAAMVASLIKMKRLSGVMRPAIAVSFPTAKGISVLIDGGANMDCKPWHLVQFAIMGSIYAKHIFNTANPSVGILSVGEEESKGNDLTRETIPLLKKSGLNFHGPVEGRELPMGTIDVIVCDGFVGNICLKACEGLASTMFGMIKKEIMSSPVSRFGALFVKGAFRNLKTRLNPDEFGGAPLLGVNGTVIICHGKSNSRAMFNGIRVASEMLRANVNERIRHSLETIKETLESLKEKETQK